MSREILSTGANAERFVRRYGVVLRYQATADLPLASLRAAAGPADSKAALVRSIELTNHLLGTARAVEVNVVAGRLTLVDRALAPALYALVRRGRPPSDLSGVSLQARTAYALVKERGAVSAGDVRTHLGVTATPRHDPAYEALGELQRWLLVDRGPFVIPKSGVPYLSREGYPHRLFHQAHPDLVEEAESLSVADAADRWLGAYLAGVGPRPTPRKIASLFKLFLTRAEIAAALGRLGLSSWA
jgi:hypothetical protein